MRSAVSEEKMFKERISEECLVLCCCKNYSRMRLGLRIWVEDAVGA